MGDMARSREMSGDGQMEPDPPRQVNVLVTGFGPFRRTLRNPSWEAAKILAETRIRTGVASHDDPRRTIDIAIDAAFVPAEYAHVSRALAHYHGNSDDRPRMPRDACEDPDIAARDDFREGVHYDVVLHIGQGRAGGIRLETQAHGLGYRLLDAGGSLPPVVEDSGGAQDAYVRSPEQHMNVTERESGLDRGYVLPKRHGLDVDLDGGAGPLRTTLDTAHLAGVLSKRFPGCTIERSVDAGRYVCEYIYFGSLAECAMARRRKDKDEGGEAQETRVLFVHVPPATERLTTSDMAEVLRALVEEIVRGVSC